jgi:hypothetical protein
VLRSADDGGPPGRRDPLDDTLGRGAQEALRRRGGSIFRVLEGGEIGLGVAAVPEPGPTD